MSIEQSTAIEPERRTLWLVEDANRGPQIYYRTVVRDDVAGGWATPDLGYGALVYLDSQIGRRIYLDEAAAQREYLTIIRQHLAWLLSEEEDTLARLATLAEGASA